MVGGKGFTLGTNVKKGRFILGVMQRDIKYRITNNITVPPHKRLNTVLEQHGAKVRSVNSLSNFVTYNLRGLIKITRDKRHNIYEKI